MNASLGYRHVAEPVSEIVHSDRVGRLIEHGNAAQAGVLLAIGLAAAIWAPWLGAGPEWLPGATRLDDATNIVGHVCIVLWLVIVLRDVGVRPRRGASED